MSSPAFLPATDDAQQREEAIDPRESFLVQAPAGSGKTELLIQRFLRLLAVVERPEAIVAVTFTRKAAGEMVERILGALRAAKLETPVEKPHEVRTRELADAALARDGEFGWNLLDHPARLRVQTIDSLCVAITSEMPWLARLGGMPRIEEDATELYREAARRTLLRVDDARYGESILHLLRHLDNEAGRARDMIADMLAKREQWIALAVQAGASSEDARRPLEEALQRLIARGSEAADELVPAHSARALDDAGALFGPRCHGMARRGRCRKLEEADRARINEGRRLAPAGDGSRRISREQSRSRRRTRCN